MKRRNYILAPLAAVLWMPAIVGMVDVMAVFWVGEQLSPLVWDYDRKLVVIQSMIVGVLPLVLIDWEEINR